MKSTIPLTLLCLALLTPFAAAKKTQSQRTEALTPEEQQKTFTLPEGYVIELVASEKDGLINPIDMAFDDDGRLWTQTARMYPLDPGKDIGWGQLLKLMANPELRIYALGTTVCSTLLFLAVIYFARHQGSRPRD